jgi:CO/xanthine dehydrogenase Mo-binding subunit
MRDGRSKTATALGRRLCYGRSDGHITVWSHTQGAYPLRGDLAQVLNLPVEKVDVIHVAGLGCYGHNGADDAALDAALLARALNGRPVKLQWMPDDAFGWSPASPAMAMHMRAGLSREGKMVDWEYELWSNSHATRPSQSGASTCSLRGTWKSRFTSHRRWRFRSHTETAIATQCLSTTCRGGESSTIF